MTARPTAFVLMPFNDELDIVYDNFIYPTLNELTYDVKRADDVESQQNILRDIVEHIAERQLIIADLTALNPNVFYELGLAHAFGKPVILLTQDIEEVPFDLRSYRLIEYSTHFVRIQNAKDKLADYAKGFLEGTIRFGSPVSDFYPSVSNIENLVHHSIVPTNTAAQHDDRGFLDHQIALTEGYNRIADIINGSTNEMEDLTSSLEESASEMNKLTSRPHAGTPRALRALSRRLAAKINDFSTHMKTASAEYSEILQEMEDSLEFLLDFQRDEVRDSAEADEFIGTLLAVEETASEARNSYLDLASNMDAMPQIERRLNQAVASGSGEVRAMANNIDRHIASLSRVRQKYN